MIDAAPWIQKQTLALLSQKGHAWLLQGPSGLGQYELATATHGLFAKARQAFVYESRVLRQSFGISLFNGL